MAVGGVLVRTTGSVTQTGPGTAGHVLTSNGAGVAPTFQAASGGGAMVLLEEQTPSSGTSITFSSLGSATHLELRYSGRGDTAANQVDFTIRFNGDTGANYDTQYLNVNNATVAGGSIFAATSGLIGTLGAATTVAGGTGVGVISIMDYRGTTLRKMATNFQGRVVADSSPNFHITNFSVQWRSTAAITSITFTLAAGNFASGKFSLYGIT